MMLAEPHTDKCRVSSDLPKGRGIAQEPPQIDSPRPTSTLRNTAPGSEPRRVYLEYAFGRSFHYCG